MDPEEEDSGIVRITLLGASQTGKTLFASSVVNRSISRSPIYQRTTRNIIRYVQLRPREGVGIHLEDTPGTTRVSGETLKIRRNHVFIVFFDWSRPETRRVALEIINEIRDAEIRLKTRPLRPIFLVGNKKDIVPTDQEREIDRLKKLAQSPQQFYLFSGSVIQNSFALVEKPKKRDRGDHLFARVHELKSDDDFRIQFTAVQLVENLRALFEGTCHGNRQFASLTTAKDEWEPLLEKPSIALDDESVADEGLCARFCRCCRRRKG